MKPIDYSLPKATGFDLVGQTIMRRAAKELRKQDKKRMELLSRCLGTGSCDCRLCK